MSSTLAEPHKFDNFIGQNYQLALNQSIQALFDSFHKPNFNSSLLTSTFKELLQSTANPPLETIWVYSALTFFNTISTKDQSFDIFSAAKDLFQLITSCSASCVSLKCIALIAPVVYNLCNTVVELKEKDLGLKRERKAMREIKGFVDLILGYVNVCCEGCLSGDGDSGLDNLIRSLEDLASIWIGDRVVENEGVNEGLRVFFPLLSVGIVEEIGNRDCGVSELAGVVILEAFLLKLCLGFREGNSKMELKNELRTWAIGSITGFQNIHFFENLVRILLESTLPVACILNFEDEKLLREVLYDVVILVEYSFLNDEIAAHLPAKHIKRLAVARLMVTHEAIEFCRECGHHTKALAYTSAFAFSHLPTELIKFVTSELGVEGKSNGPNGSAPKAYLKWLLNLENRGIKLFEDNMSKWRAKLVLDNSKEDDGQSAYKTDGNKADTDLFFYMDNKGEEDDGNNGSMSAAFVAAAHTMQSIENDGERKRKDGPRLEKRNQVKFVKYNLNDDSGSSGNKSTYLTKDDGSSSESEVENPLSNGDM